MNAVLLNVAAFYLGWFACILGAGQGYPFVGPVVVAALIAVHLWLRTDPLQEARLVVTVGLIGTGIDTVLMTSGVFTFTDHSIPWLCPLWLTALWLNFATTLHTSLSWLAGRYFVAAVLGAVGGPLSYYAGAKMMALTLYPQPVVSISILAFVWAVTMPVLVWLAASSEKEA